MEEDTIKKSKNDFFYRIKTAIFGVENYGKFLSESPSKAFKYLFLLVLIITVFTTFFAIFSLSQKVNKLVSYLDSSLPEFSYENDILKFDEYVEAYDSEENMGFIINTFDVSDAEKTEYFQKINNYGFGIIFLKDKLYALNLNKDLVEMSYNEMFDETASVSINNKSEFIDSINKNKFIVETIVFFIYFFAAYIAKVFSYLMDVCLIAIVGFIIAKLSGVNLKMIGAIELAIYSLTLSSILSGLYEISNYLFPQFVISQFVLIYLLLAYVYLIAAILIIKDDLIKEQVELQKLEELQKEVRKEMNEEKEENPENAEEKNTEEDPIKTEENNDNNVNNEPDGSEI